MKTNRKLSRSLACASALALMMGWGASGFAAPLLCSVNDATANAAYADACKRDSAIGANEAAETAFVNTNFQGLGDAFVLVDKSDGDSTVAGFELTVVEGTTTFNGVDYLFSYELAVPADRLGDTVDWVLLVKQNSGDTVAYLFEDVILDVDGLFNNFTLGGNDQTVNDYSHITGFLRDAGTTDDDETVPEPGMLFLMGAGLLGLGMARRRKPA